MTPWPDNTRPGWLESAEFSAQGVALGRQQAVGRVLFAVSVNRGGGATSMGRSVRWGVAPTV
ncbi:MAG: hypothetical protein KatS3mg065_0762 [Chloroflexota bacterium]|nr:MAG: hypothetical protein KatS3mg065_0762 [Chloroflexota bacterium]